ncbi:GNAT family N-acetyltransferase [Sphingobium nicotianae]|uniref:GNAT family N-acetyltransferase n=1 Tax=Sphingobium nicotianae TaxID=2782607 RepID=A0A9X1DDY2_9SPHN|nr:GNAT family N-acetyltransferase [Sphingobium nicotianae]MBT2188417.1 GNAT family N-acetyltransferase [Sphingobium nicotianae]
MSGTFSLVVPSMDHLPAYRAALEMGWSPNNIDGEKTRLAELAAIDSDAPAFLTASDDPEGRLPGYTAPDGTVLPRIPGYRRWMWDGDFCGSISFRWLPGTSDLPPHVLGHIGFAVIPAKRGNGYAAGAVMALLPDARSRGLSYIEITANEDNLPSRRTIERCGGVLIERFTKIAAYGGAESLRYRIAL